MSYRAAIFDLDGTLLDSMPIWVELCPEFLRRHGIEPAPGLNEALGAMNMPGAIRYLLREYPLAMNEDEVTCDIRAILADYYRNRAVFKPGIPELLAGLRERHIKTGIASATEPALVDLALRRLGIEHAFDGGVMSCAERNTSKKKPDIFFWMAEKLGARPEETVVFEDALYAARTAKAAGFPLAAVFDPTEPGQEELRRLADWYCLSWVEFPVSIFDQSCRG